MRIKADRFHILYIKRDKNTVYINNFKVKSRYLEKENGSVQFYFNNRYLKLTL